MEDTNKKITRREALGMLAAVGAATVVGCSSANVSGASGSGTTGTTTTTSSSSSASCVLTPGLTIGPYFVDENLNRSDLTSNTSDTNVTQGVPLGLQLTIVKFSSSGCNALQSAQVDVWHADAGGVYSDEAVENTVGQTYLRGYQITDSNGQVSFKTIYPGWYSGRTVHIHVMVRTFSSSGAVASETTTQLFFDDSLTDQVFANAPYNSRGQRNTRNSQDGIYNSATQLSLQSSGSGYASAITIGIQTA